MRRSGGLVFGLALIVSGCANVAQTPSKPAPSGPVADFQVWLGMAGQCRLGRQFSVREFNGGREVRTFPTGIVSRDWTRLYTIDAQGWLRSIDLSTGASVGETRVPSSFDWPQLSFCPEDISPLSPNGAWVVLQSLDRDNQVVTRSHYAVLDTSFKHQPRRVDLDGRWDFDAVSDDGQRLYLLQVDVQPPNGYQYRVRLVDLSSGQLVPGAIVDKRDRGDLMSGTRLLAMPSLDDAWLYSLYLFGKNGPFIHALNLNQPIAWCVDLPSRGQQVEPSGLLWAAAMSPDGNRLYAVNAGIGIVAEVALGSPPAVQRKADFKVSSAPTSSLFGLVVNAEAKRVLSGGAAVSPDGARLYAIGEDGVYVIDTAKLSVSGHLLAGLALDSLLLSPDGLTLFATSAESRTLARVDLLTGTTTRIDGYWGEVMRVEPLYGLAEFGAPDRT